MQILFIFIILLCLVNTIYMFFYQETKFKHDRFSISLSILTFILLIVYGLVLYIWYLHIYNSCLKKCWEIVFLSTFLWCVRQWGTTWWWKSTISLYSKNIVCFNVSNLSFFFYYFYLFLLVIYTYKPSFLVFYPSKKVYLWTHLFIYR